MGYSTQFKGVLKFGSELTVPMLTKLENILGEDVRDHPEWDVPKDLWMTYIDLETTEGYTGLRWTGDEKTYGMEHAISLIVRLMREDFPDFSLTGKLYAQGEEAVDVYTITVENDVVTVKELGFDNE